MTSSQKCDPRWIYCSSDVWKIKILITKINNLNPLSVQLAIATCLGQQLLIIAQLIWQLPLVAHTVGSCHRLPLSLQLPQVAISSCADRCRIPRHSCPAIWTVVWNGADSRDDRCSWYRIPYATRCSIVCSGSKPGGRGGHLWGNTRYLIAGSISRRNNK